MSATHGAWVAAVREAVRAVLIEERVFEGIRDRLQPPAAVESERALIAGLLSGNLDRCVIGELEPKAFLVPMHRWIWARLHEGARTIEDLVEAAQGEGATGYRLREEIELWPVVLAPPVEDHIEAVREKARLRRIRDALQKICLGIDLRELSSAEIREALKGVA